MKLGKKFKTAGKNRRARIICTDRKCQGDFKILALVQMHEEEVVVPYSSDLVCKRHPMFGTEDLTLVEVK